MINVGLCVISLGLNDCRNRAGQKTSDNHQRHKCRQNTNVHEVKINIFKKGTTCQKNHTQRLQISDVMKHEMSGKKYLPSEAQQNGGSPEGLSREPTLHRA